MMYEYHWSCVKFIHAIQQSVFCSQQAYHGHEWRQVVYTCKQESYVPETKSDIWADFGLWQWWVQDWHCDNGRGVGVMRRLKMTHWYNTHPQCD